MYIYIHILFLLLNKGELHSPVLLLSRQQISGDGCTCITNQLGGGGCPCKFQKPERISSSICKLTMFLSNLSFFRNLHSWFFWVFFFVICFFPLFSISVSLFTFDCMYLYTYVTTQITENKDPPPTHTPRAPHPRDK